MTAEEKATPAFLAAERKEAQEKAAAEVVQILLSKCNVKVLTTVEQAPSLEQGTIQIHGKPLCTESAAVVQLEWVEGKKNAVVCLYAMPSESLSASKP